MSVSESAGGEGGNVGEERGEKGRDETRVQTEQDMKRALQERLMGGEKGPGSGFSEKGAEV